MLSLSTYLTLESVKIAPELSSQKKVLERLAGLLTPIGKAHSTPLIYDGLIKREKLGSTAIGHGFAIPHTRLAEIEQPKIALLKTTPIELDASDQHPVSFFIGMVVPESNPTEHLNVLATLAGMLKKEAFRDKLTAAQNEHELLHAFLLANVS